MIDLNVLKQCYPKNEKHEYFQAGAYKNLSFNMFTGDEVLVKIKAVKWLEEYVYRAFANAKKVAENETSIIMEIKVFGTEGILFWILGQQERVEVLEPLSLREKIKEKIFMLSKLFEI
jgi:predicted DNA-binding transcriptional regulator YafY